MSRRLAENGKLPWFPFHVDRFQSSRAVRRMSAEEVGIYILLLVEEWDSRAPLPTRGADLEDICHRADVADIRRVLRLCFKRTKDGWVNEVLENIRAEQENRHEKRVEAGKKRKQANA